MYQVLDQKDLFLYKWALKVQMVVNNRSLHMCHGQIYPQLTVHELESVLPTLQVQVLTCQPRKCVNSILDDLLRVMLGKLLIHF